MRAAPWGEERGVVVQKGGGGWREAGAKESGSKRERERERERRQDEDETGETHGERTEREEARWRMRKKLCKTPVSYLLRCIKFPVRVPVLYKIMLMSRGPLRMAACWS